MDNLNCLSSIEEIDVSVKSLPKVKSSGPNYFIEKSYQLVPVKQRPLQLD